MRMNHLSSPSDLAGNCCSMSLKSCRTSSGLGLVSAISIDYDDQISKVLQMTTNSKFGEEKTEAQWNGIHCTSEVFLVLLNLRADTYYRIYIMLMSMARNLWFEARPTASIFRETSLTCNQVQSMATRSVSKFSRK